MYGSMIIDGLELKAKRVFAENTTVTMNLNLLKEYSPFWPRQLHCSGKVQSALTPPIPPLVSKRKESLGSNLGSRQLLSSAWVQ